MLSYAFVIIIIIMYAGQSAFRVSSVNDSGRSHILQANDELDKRHWLQCIDEALAREVLPVTSAKLDASTSKFSAEFQSPGSSRKRKCCSAAAGAEDVESSTNNGLEAIPPLAPCTSSSVKVSRHILEEL